MAILGMAVVTTAIAYSFIQYYLATDDLSFMKYFGAEALFETARLWKPMIILLVFGFAGLRIKEEGISFQPALPENWEGYTFSIQFKGRKHQIEKTAEQTVIKLLQGEDLSINVFEQSYQLEKESPITIS